MFEPAKIIAALLAIVGTTGIFLLWDRVCHALRVACAAGIVLLAGLFYGSGLAISGGALGIVLGSLTALLRTSLLRQRPAPGVRHEAGN